RLQMTLPTPSHIAWQPILSLSDGRVLGYEALARFAGTGPLAVFQELDPDRAVALDHTCVAHALAAPPPTGLLFLNPHACHRGTPSGAAGAVGPLGPGGVEAAGDSRLGAGPRAPGGGPGPG
ncbi:MAG: hypothetical protein OWV35_09635, partial [Firmicutes bacterium]|nr:hypothetical protein [Bacillota bacterium]